MKRVVVVGAGYWGKNLVRNFHELDALYGICDTSEAVQAEAKTAYPKAIFYREYGKALSDPEVTAVALSTPAVTHYELARQALSAGKDVFVEKPLAIHVKEADELVGLAESRGRILMVGHILRYHPAILELQRLIKEGALGRVNYVYSNRLNIGKIRTEENILWSFAPHDISTILALLGEMPLSVACQGGAYLSQNVADVTVSQFVFPSGTRAHIYVSWLHPFKEQRLVVVGSEKMAVFDDTAAHKLLLYPHRVQWKNRVPTAVKAEGEAVDLPPTEPLKAECRHFLECVAGRSVPRTDGKEGLRVLRVLEACEKSLLAQGAPVGLTPLSASKPSFFVHESAYVDDGAEVGEGTKVWHFSHVMKGAKIGKKCVIGQNVNIDGGTVLGDNVKIQNNVSVYTGTVIEDDVFLGPSCVLTNVTNPRSQVNRHSLYEKTVLRKGCSVGANATVVCGVTVGRYAFVGAGAVVTKDVADYALVVGNPARQVGWMSRHGHRLSAGADGIMVCPESGFRYEPVSADAIHCLDLDEESPLPEHLRVGAKTYDEFKLQTPAQGVKK
jgi:UDP-2-acetamido-3-amino-2,3-dideoxy-glucuronate N-acetyltransferase